MSGERFFIKLEMKGKGGGDGGSGVSQFIKDINYNELCR